MATTVGIEVEGAVATLWLNGAPQRNALSLSTWEAIPAAVAEAEAATGCRVIVIRGRGGHFGAGGDIKEFCAVFADEASTLVYFDRMEAAMRSIETARLPTVALIEGLCVGACVALALACEIRLGAAASSYAITPAKLGIAYPYGDIARVVSAIGASRTKTLMYSGVAIPAETALVYGLIDRVIAADSDTAAFVSAVAASSPWTIATTRRAIHNVGLDRSNKAAGYPETLVAAVTGTDFAEGMNAFIEKRTAVFSDVTIAPARTAGLETRR